jgi:hypothetical protein
MMSEPIPEFATAQKRRNSGDQQTDTHDAFIGVVLVVQVMPSGEVAAPGVVVFPTAQNSPSSGAQQTAFH